MARGTKPALSVLDGGANSSASSVGVESSGVVASGESEQVLLRAGKISVDEYVDLVVDRALSHLTGRLSAPRLALMREVLKNQVAQDPHLVSLTERVASGE